MGWGNRQLNDFKEASTVARVRQGSAPKAPGTNMGVTEAALQTKQRPCLMHSVLSEVPKS